MSSALLSDLFSADTPPEPSPATVAAEVSRALREARAAQPAWAAAPLRHRLKVLRRFRHRLAARPDEFASAVELPQRKSEAETIAAEILPLADACKWLEAEAASVLAPRTLSNRHRPLWLTGVRVTERRDPFGVVLILGTWNDPLFLSGVQAAQALAAGNAVLLKPGRGSAAAAEALRDGLHASGLDPRLLAVLPESPAAAEAAIDAGVGKVVLTGSADTGRKVLARLAGQLTPTDLELSGCDAVFVRGDADLDLVVRALTLGMTFNGSATCIAPRRVFAHRSVAAELESRLAQAFAAGAAPVPIESQTAERLESLLSDALRYGARLVTGGTERAAEGARVRPLLLADAPTDAELLKSDLFAPVLSLVPVGSDEEALRLDRKCPYALGASVFGRPEPAAALAAKVEAGCVVVNDLIVPTADPRVAFGGRKWSGYGLTRGAAGLLAMTQPKTVVERTSIHRSHLEPVTESDSELFKSYLAAAHGRNWRARVRAALRFLREAYRRQQERRSISRQAESSRPAEHPLPTDA
ncbi:MAG TPA: aldehyde dehydrogenase family protein [Planctomycetaceae bacterium]